MKKNLSHKIVPDAAWLQILPGNLFILYCILFQGLSLYGIIYIFFIDIAVSVAFNLSRAERAKVNTKIDNDMKYAGELTWWDERKYRGKSEYLYAIGNIILLSVLFMFIGVIPFVVEGERHRTFEEFNALFPFHSAWFWSCIAANILLQAGLHFYHFISGTETGVHFEEIIRIDYFRYWLFFAFIIVGAAAIAFINAQTKFNPLTGTVVYGILYSAVKSYLELRDRKKQFAERETMI